jgi:hypothetical protein
LFNFGVYDSLRYRDKEDAGVFFYFAFQYGPSVGFHEHGTGLGSSSAANSSQCSVTKSKWWTWPKTEQSGGAVPGALGITCLV